MREGSASFRFFRGFRRNGEETGFRSGLRVAFEEVAQDSVVRAFGVIVGFGFRSADGRDVHHTAHHTAHAAHHTAAHAAHHAAAHAAHHAAHAAHHTAHAAHHAAALVRLHNEVGDGVESQAGRNFRVGFNFVLGGDEERVVQDAEVEVVRTQNDLQRVAERNAGQVFLNHDRRGGPAGFRFFNINIVKNDVNVFAFFAELTFNVFNPRGEGKVGVFAAFDVDFNVKRLADALFRFGTLEVRRAIFFLTHLGERDPDFRFRIGDRRLVGDRNMRAFDGHQRVKQVRATFHPQHLVLFPSVGQTSDVRGLRRERCVFAGNFSGFVGGFRGEDELAFFDQRVEALHDFFDFKLILLARLLRFDRGVDDRLILHRGVIANRFLFFFERDLFGASAQVVQNQSAIGGREDFGALNASDLHFNALERGVRIVAGEFARFGHSDLRLRLHLLRHHANVRFGRVDQIRLVLIFNDLFGASEKFGGIGFRFFDVGREADFDEIGQTFRVFDGAVGESLVDEFKRFVGRGVQGDLTRGEELRTGDRKGRAGIGGRVFDETVKVLVARFGRARGNAPSDFSFASVGDRRGDRNFDVFVERFGRFTDDVGFAVAADRRERARVDFGAGDRQRVFFRPVDGRGRGSGEARTGFFGGRFFFNDVTAGAVGQRAEHVFVDGRPDAESVDRDASVDEFFDRFAEDFFVKRRAGADAATDENDRAVGVFVEVERIGGDGKGFFKVGRAERSAGLQRSDRVAEFFRIDRDVTVGQRFDFVRNGEQLNASVRGEIRDHRRDRRLRLRANVGI